MKQGVKPEPQPTMWHPGAGDPTTWGQPGGMPAHYGESSFAAAMGHEFSEIHYWEAADPWNPGEKLMWPSKNAYRQFMEDLENSFPEGYMRDGIPVVISEKGWEAVTFQGWADGKPTFGVGGRVQAYSAAMPIQAQEEHGMPRYLYFSTQAQADTFSNSHTLPDGTTWDQGSGTFKKGGKTIEPEIIGGDGGILGGGTGGDGAAAGDPPPEGTPVLNPDGTPKLNPDGSPVLTGPPAAGGDAGTDPIMQDLASVGADKESFRMFDRFLQQIDTSVFDADADLASTLAVAIKDLEIMAMSDTQNAAKRMQETVINALDRAAITARAKADRDLQQGAAVGSIDIEGVGATRTLASRIEQNKMILQQALLAGQIPEMDADGNFTLEFAKDTEGAPLQTLEARQQERELTMSETEKLDNKNINMAKVFGTWLPTAAKSADGTATPEAIQTLESKKFGLTRSIHEAEVTGLIPRDMMGEHQLDQQVWRDKHRLGLPETLSAKRMAWERDVAVMNAESARRKSFNEAERITMDLQIQQNKASSAEAIAAGKLAEAVEARKDATFLAKQKLDLEREKMKIDTLTALANPATYLFAVRYGLLEQIGGALGIDWGDDAISSDEVPSMVAPGTFPSMTDFQRATPSERQIMLAEVASSGGFTTDEAVRMIMEGAPGGRDIRRTSLVGVTR